jgi:hypothetical protein
VLFSFDGGMGFELRASYLLGRCSTTIHGALMLPYSHKTLWVNDNFSSENKFIAL